MTILAQRRLGLHPFTNRRALAKGSAQGTGTVRSLAKEGVLESYSQGATRSHSPGLAPMQFT